MFREDFHFKWFSIDLVNEWSQLIGKYNWYTFTPLHFRVEKECIHGTAEVELYFLGFGLRVYWVWNQEMFNAKAEEYSKRLEEGIFKEL